MGLVLSAIDESNQYDNTIVIFASDNGGVVPKLGAFSGHRPNGNLLGQKTDTWEGGHRIPFIVRWPGHFPEGKTSAELVSLDDVMATLAATLDIDYDARSAIDSINQIRLLQYPDTAKTSRRDMVLRGINGLALRFDQWVLIPDRTSQGGHPGYSRGFVNIDLDDTGQPDPAAPETQLYNLAMDTNEVVNLHRVFPRISKFLRGRLDRIVAENEVLEAAKPRPR